MKNEFMWKLHKEMITLSAFMMKDSTYVKNKLLGIK